MKNLFVVSILALAFSLATTINCSANERFSRTADGVITDSKTNLQWLPGPDKDTDYRNAERWVAAQTVDGGGWRMPTREELKTLYDSHLPYGISPVFKATDYRWVWADMCNSSAAGVLDFDSGDDDCHTLGSPSDSRVFAVRRRTMPVSAGEKTVTGQTKLAEANKATTQAKSSPEVALSGVGKKQSYAEGRLVNWNGEPAGGIKIIATFDTYHYRSPKGYEQVETITGDDGSFNLSGLFPTPSLPSVEDFAQSEYTIKLWSDKWETNEVKGITAARRGGLICLDKVCRFLSGISACGYAASCTVDSITAYASSGVFFCNLECGLEWLYQSR